MTPRQKLLKALEEAGIPDRFGWVSGIRSRVADMLVQVVKERGRTVVAVKMSDALDLAEQIAQTPPGEDPHAVAIP